jgi:hypothetical protein
MECKESRFAILYQISCHHICHLFEGEDNWAQIIFNSLCSELDQWYKYVKDNKGDKKDTCNLPWY